MRSVEAEGSTIDDAIGRALELLHIERDKVDIEILENSSRGLLGFGGKPARVRATVRGRLVTDVATEEPSPVPQATVAPASGSRSSDAGVQAARHAFEEILRQLGVDTTIDVTRGDDGSWRFGIVGEGAGIVIGRHGQTLDAVEYLLNRIASHETASPVRIAIDVEGYRERRQESLEQTARRAAEKARHTGRPVTLNPMSPRDRRIVHVALSEERGVTTRSQGEGSYRRVVVVPTASGRSRY